MFCRAPFIGLSINPEATFCCCFSNCEYENNIQQHRIDMYNNKISKLCENCTMRNEFNNDKYDDIYNKNLSNFNIIDGSISNFQIGWLHIVPTVRCNSDCIMCRVKNTTDKMINEHNIECILSNHIKHVSLQGGEIFLFPNYITKIISKINSDTLHVITNGTIYDDKILSELDNSKAEITLSISIDGNKKTNHIFRKGCNYDNTIANVLKIHQNYPKFRLVINYTIHIFNIYDIIDDLILLKQNLPFDFILCLNLVVQPRALSIINLDQENKEQIKDMLNIDYYIKRKDFVNVKKIGTVLSMYKNRGLFNQIFDIINKTSMIESKYYDYYLYLLNKRQGLIENTDSRILNFIYGVYSNRR